MSTHTLLLTETLRQYLLDKGVREHPLLAELRETTARSIGAQMQISPEQGAFMQLLVQLMRAQKIIELGTFTGYSSLAMALAMPADGKIVTCDIDERSTATAKIYWKKAQVDHKIDLQMGSGLATLERLKQHEANTFDLAFIDADKANYSAYFDACYDLVRTGGLILIDNVLWSGAVVDAQMHDKSTEAIRALNDKVCHDNRFSISMLPIGDGLTLALKK